MKLEFNIIYYSGGMVFMNSYEIYKTWLMDEYFNDKEIRNELYEIRDNKEEIEERFYKELEFGTAGLRGLIGAGTNRMNIYTVRKASQGVADYINRKINSDVPMSAQYPSIPMMVIAYDSRYKSKDFAMETACVFAANNIKTFIFDEIEPVAVLSFAIRHLNAKGGVAITASHNPKNYNGYKVYREDGGQLLSDESADVLAYIKNIKNFSDVKTMQFDEAVKIGLIESIGHEIEDLYINIIKKYCINKDIVKDMGRKIRIVYTPLNGSGNKLVRRILDEIGFENVFVVKEQEYPDPEFPTVVYPNPEDKRVFKLPLQLAEKEDADLIIATDPDCDRIGIMSKCKSGDYLFLTGNQIGCIMLLYILRQKNEKGVLPNNGFVVKTIVSTVLANRIAEKYDVDIEEVLTGFKYIGEKIRKLDDSGFKKFLFGFEESHGYLVGTYARDKDAVSAAMLISEIAAYSRSMGITLSDVLENIYKEFGYAVEEVVSFEYGGKEGEEKIKAIMQHLRQSKKKEIACYKIISLSDYLSGEEKNYVTGQVKKLDFPRSDVIYYKLEHNENLKANGWLCIRPSGTEPKIKIYMEIFGSDLEDAKGNLNALKKEVINLISI